MKHFIISDDKKILGKVLKGLELANQKYNKLILVKLKFLMNSYKNLAKNKIKKLLETAQDLFHLIHSFWKNENIANFVSMWMLEDPIQKLTTVTSGTSCILLITFFPDKNRKLHSYKKPTHTALETLLNKVFTLNPKNNEKAINQYIKQQQLNMAWPTLSALCQSTVLVYLKLLTLDRLSFCGENIMNTDKTDETFFQ